MSALIHLSLWLLPDVLWVWCGVCERVRVSGVYSALGLIFSLLCRSLLLLLLSCRQSGFCQIVKLQFDGKEVHTPLGAGFLLSQRCVATASTSLLNRELLANYIACLVVV